MILRPGSARALSRWLLRSARVKLAPSASASPSRAPARTPRSAKFAIFNCVRVLIKSRLRMKVAHRQRKWICCYFNARAQMTSDETQRALQEIHLWHIVKDCASTQACCGLRCIRAGRRCQAHWLMQVAIWKAPQLSILPDCTPCMTSWATYN